ncbi:hypothetical protein HPB50_009641 [Hyalomma asiaticum]|uniref:Uncharacterized protein n=1 Tax=Hyalomma asiaticum TaxID=266040 RepID=A0ACB7SD71_HYAAI|nr:hypothetical protein HPB50_009641 [Hyalomma asiaticum]
MKVLARGPKLPKYGHKPRHRQPEKLGAATAIARCVAQEERSVFLGECVDCITRTACKSRAKGKLKAVIDYLLPEDPRTVMSNKERCFVVVPGDMSSQKGYDD